MKAAYRAQYCPPEALTINTVEKPSPKDHEVLVRVYATTVNRTDCAILTGKPYIMRLFTGLTKPTSPIPGTDFAGRIEAIGKQVTSFKVNDKVFGFNDQGLASQAEYMCYPAEGNIMTMPENITYEQAAASLEGAHYAYNFMNKVTLSAGKNVLVNGATGAIGSALVQFLKYHQLYVVATCATEHLDRVTSLGADRVIDYTRQDFTTDQGKYDFVFDAVGKSTFSQCKPLLKAHGIYISSELGPNLQNPFLAMITPLFKGKKVIFPIPINIKASMTFIKDLMQKGKYKPMIDNIISLEKIAQAYTYAASGQKTGNIILSMPD